MRLPLFFLPLALTATLNAQTVVFSEDFSSGVPPTGWYHQQMSSGAGWIPSTTSGTRALHEDEVGGHTSDNRLVSTTFNLNTISEAYLHFDSEMRYPTYMANHPNSVGDGVSTMEISTDSGNTWDIIWTDASLIANRDDVLVDLSAYLGQTGLLLGIHYYGTWAHEWWVDSVVISDDNSISPPIATTWDQVALPGSFAPVPFSLDFETTAGTVPPWMALTMADASTFSPDPDAWCNIGQLAPMTEPAASGSYCLEMGLQPGNLNYHLVANAMVIGLNGAGAGNFDLDFNAIQFGEEVHEFDGVWVSLDGDEWYPIFTNWSSAFTDTWDAIPTQDLLQLGLDLSGDFYIMFAQSDDFAYADVDGVGIDDITVGDGSTTAPLYVIHNLIAGQVASLECTGCPPGSLVAFGYSFAGPGPTSTPYGSLEMSMPISHVGPFPVNGQGVIVLPVLIPGNLSGLLLHTQCVIFTGGGNELSNALHQTVQ